MEHTALYDSPLGPITLIFDDGALSVLRFGTSNCDRVNSLSTLHFPLSTVFRWLDLYFTGRKPDFLPPIKLIGSPFQWRVWQALTEIPYGQTTTYGHIARLIGCRSAQAVGQAVGHNPVAIIVPCHRVVGSDGSLTGYAYGLERKEYLLGLETIGI